MVYSSFARFGAYLLTQFKQLHRMTDFEHSKTLYGVARDIKIENDFSNLQAIYKRYRLAVNKFIDISSLRLNPSEKKIIFLSLMYEFSLSAGYPNEYDGKTLDIRSNDANWYTPSSLFENYQAQASDSQEIKLKLAKWTGPPTMYDRYDTSYMETNITELNVLSTAGNQIIMDNLSDPIRSISGPWAKRNVYSYDLLDCKQWNFTSSAFETGSCTSFANYTATLSCSTCDSNSYTSTEVSSCNCTSLGMIVAHYNDTDEVTPISELQSVLPVYNLLEYWQESFGFYLTIVAGIVFFSCLVVVLFLDQFPRRKMLVKIYDKVRKRQIEEGYDKEESCSDASDESDEGEGSEDSKSTMHSVNRLSEQEGLRKRSKLKDREMEKKQKQTKEKTSDGNKSAENTINETHDMIEMKEWDESKEEKKDENLKKKGRSSQPDLLAPNHPVDTTQRQNTKGSDNSAIRMRTNNSRSNRNSGSSEDTVSNKSEDEYERKRKLEDILAEKSHYYLMNIFIQGSTLHSFLWIDSYINPRHVRGTIFFTYIVLIWYVCAVAYNNTRKPNEVPDYKRDASDLTWGEIWMAYAAPWGAAVLLYIFTIIMKLSPERIRATRTTKFLDYVMAEYGREQVLRYLMGYFIIIAVHFMIFMYIIQFTARHGWQIAWRWWYTGSLSFFINVFVYDPLIAVSHWLLYKCNRKLGRIVMAVRNMKIYRPEV